MLLQKLREFSERSGDTLPSMYKKDRVQWFIELDAEGRLIGDGFIATSGGDKKKKGKEYVVPYSGVRSSKIKPNLLADKAEYVLGIDREKTDRKTALRHASFIELIKDCAAETSNPKVKAVAKFLSSLKLGELSLPEELKHDSMVSFLVDGDMPSNDPDVQEYWGRKNGVGTADNSREKATADMVECHICGQMCIPVNPHPLNIKGLGAIGGQTSGMMMISANSPAFESYGLGRSLIAPTCQQCAEAYATAANELIKSEDSHLFVGPLVYLFWTKNNVKIPVLSLFSSPSPDPEQVKKLILSAKRGAIFDAMDDEAFYATAWSASGARIAVRNWIQTTVGIVRNNIANWFEMQRLASEYDDTPQFYGLWTLCASLYNDPNKMAPNVPEVLLRSALQGNKLPYWILYQAVKRNCAERTVTRPRLVLIKMALLSNRGFEREGYLVELDKENLDPAYLCGRLLAELEAIQKAAISANTTIVDRYYGSASSAPASVFGNLLRGAQAHLGKLRKEKPGLAVKFQIRLEEIQSGLKQFPRILTLEEQGIFALGYYHQRVSDRSGQNSEGKKV